MKMTGIQIKSKRNIFTGIFVLVVGLLNMGRETGDVKGLSDIMGDNVPFISIYNQKID